MSDQKRFYIGINSRRWECRVVGGVRQVLHDGEWIEATKLLDHLTSEEMAQVIDFGFQKYTEQVGDPVLCSSCNWIHCEPIPSDCRNCGRPLNIETR